MSELDLNILFVNTADQGGGAARVAWNLFTNLPKRGCHTKMAVGHKHSNHPEVFELTATAGIGERLALDAARWLEPLEEKRVPAVWRMRKWLLGSSARQNEQVARQGADGFGRPAAFQILNHLPKRPDVICCHNLHGSFFDLDALSTLSEKSALVLRLPDEWMLTGRCAYTFGCTRWTHGCGTCPHLWAPPEAKEDNSAEYWRRKREAYIGCRLFVVTPSMWLMRKVQRSMMAPMVKNSRVIYNGVDRTVFCPGDRAAAREQLGLPKDAFILLFSAKNIVNNQFKDYKTLRAAAERIAGVERDTQVLLLGLGDDAEGETINNLTVRFVPYEHEVQNVTQYYQAADVYAHAAHADNSPNSILEALACGIPVVASAVCGIPEHVKALPSDKSRTDLFEKESTGFLVPDRDSESMAAALVRLMRFPKLRLQLGENAAKDAAERFDLERMLDEYLDFYNQCIELCKQPES